MEHFVGPRASTSTASDVSANRSITGAGSAAAATRALAEARNAHQVERPEWELLAQLVEVAQPAGRDELRHLVRDSLPDARHLRQRAVLHTLVQPAWRARVRGEGVERVRAEIVCANLERVLTLDLQELRNLPQSLCDLPRCHASRSVDAS